MTIADLDEVTYDLEVDGEEVRRETARAVWERSGWATVAIAFAERAKDGGWTSKLALLRFRRIHDAWSRQSQVTLGDGEARELAQFVDRSFPA